MVCGSHILEVANHWAAWSPEELSKKDTDFSIASSGPSSEYAGLAPPASDDQDVPPMIELERDTTYTEYNEIRTCEWERPACEWERPAVLTSWPQLAISMTPVPFVMVPFPALHGSELMGITGNAQLNVPWESIDMAYGKPQQHQHQHQQQHVVDHTLIQYPSWPAHEVPTPKEWCSVDYDRLSQELTAGGDQRQHALASLRGQVARLSFEPAGCRVVQLAIQVAEKDAVGEIVAELHGHVCSATQSPYGNYVIQKIIEVLPVSLASFIAEELLGVAGKVARNRYGCRILCRIFEHSAADDGPSMIADELITEACELSRHTFGHHVMQTVLEHGLASHRRGIVDALAPQLWANAHDRCASYVLETGLMKCQENEQRTLAAGFLCASSERMVALGRSQAGHRVLKALGKSQGDVSQTLRDSLRASAPQLGEHRHGRRLLHDLKTASMAAAA